METGADETRVTSRFLCGAVYGRVSFIIGRLSLSFQMLALVESTKMAW